MSTVRDLLADARWECAASPGGVRGQGPDGSPDRDWVPASVPGTAAGALLDAGDDLALLRDYDAQEWWFRCTVAAPDAADVRRWRLQLDGLATMADVWVADEHVLRSTNMFHRHDVTLGELPAGLAEIPVLIRFAPLAEAETPRRPRARWRTMRLASQQQRWHRTSLIGRTTSRPVLPAPVGPWAPVRLVPDVPAVRRRQLVSRTHPDGSGTVSLVVDLDDRPDLAGQGAVVVVGDTRHDAVLQPHASGARLETDVELPQVRLWWPHTHGDQPLYPVSLEVGGREVSLGRTAFRTVTVDRTDGGFGFVVNGVPVFSRGTSWTLPDPVRLHLDDARLRANVELLRDGNHTMVRVPGNGVWEDDRFLDLLDELGLMLWQDCMFAYADLPDEPAFVASVETELRDQLSRLQGRPCVALVCGAADAEEQAAYFGTPLAAATSRVTDEVVPALVEELLPGTAYLRGTPGDSPLPTAPDRGVTHYFGVPGYRRPLSDVRAAGVRFAAECLPVPTPHDPLPDEVAAALTRGLGRAPDPRHAVHRDSVRTPWDMEDTRDHYVRELFGIDALAVRQEDPGRADEVFAATAVALYEHVLAEWRRPGSPCRGALTFYGHDLLLGPGLGLVDAADRPKPTWYAMRRLMQPLAVLLTDEGFSGLGVHVVNDRPEPLEGTVTLELYVDGETSAETGSVAVAVPAHGATTVDVSTLFGGFRDLTWAHRFGPPQADVVAATLSGGPHGETLAEAVWLPAGPARARERDLGLDAVLDLSGPFVELTSRRFAHGVRVDVPGWRAEDDWFTLLPGRSRRVLLRRTGNDDGAAPRGRVTALNAVSASPLRT